MAVHEFDLIQTYFAGLGCAAGSASMALGIGDDCALFSMDPDCQLAVTTDSLVEGVHFFAGSPADLIARRSLRVNLSDLAAMGAEPIGCQLALTLPQADPHWLEAFSRGLSGDLALFGCPLTGGDTTRGPLTITLTLLGQVPKGQALCRSGARVGDLLYVTGTLGDACGGLKAIEQKLDHTDFLRQAYWLPHPRLQAGRQLRQLASASLDISDGLVQDAGHIARQSGVGMVIRTDRLPLSSELLKMAGREQAQQWALSGGDDYELCFTLAPDRVAALEQAMAQINQVVVCIGEVIAGAGVHCVDAEGHAVTITEAGYVHF